MVAQPGAKFTRFNNTLKNDFISNKTACWGT